MQGGLNVLDTFQSPIKINVIGIREYGMDGNVYQDRKFCLRKIIVQKLL